MTGKLEGKVALVTGASSGIGKATAIAFAREGAKVVLAARREEMLEAVAETIRAAGGEAAVAVGDASKEADCKRMVDKALDIFGGLHIAFNNHGVSWVGLYTTASEEDVTKTLDINLKSLVFCFKYQIPAMAKSGGKGSIIVNSSMGGSRVADFGNQAHTGVYAASKAGADMLMKYAAIEGAASGIRVNSIAPGITETPMAVVYSPEALEHFLKNKQVFDRMISPEEIAKLVIFLASDDAAMVTGSVYPMDAGFGIKA